MMLKLCSALLAWVRSNHGVRSSELCMYNILKLHSISKDYKKRTVFLAWVTVPLQQRQPAGRRQQLAACMLPPTALRTMIDAKKF